MIRGSGSETRDRREELMHCRALEASVSMDSTLPPQKPHCVVPCLPHCRFAATDNDIVGSTTGCPAAGSSIFEST
jgi:hypothetical protein